MPAPSSSSVPLIKGYLPVRLKLPTSHNEYEDETFFFVREHKEKSHGNKSNKSTLFVANAPIIPGVATKILLKSIFGRYADIPRVTVVQNPRNDPNHDNVEDFRTSLTWSTKARHPTFLPPIHSEGKYAHIIFNSPKDMKKTMRALQDVMRPKGDDDDDDDAGLKIERIEIQTLSDETNRQYRENRQKELGQDEEGSGDDDEGDASETKTGIHAVAERYRASCHEVSRAELLEECNVVMQDYEDAEEAKRREQEVAKSQPDGDGFVTVSYSNAVGSKTQLEESATATTPNRRNGNKRSRKRKEQISAGNQELQDFYRFQRRDNRKRSLADLRTQFEEDLQKVKRMKEERHYRPF
jgi:ribosomal RNA-processing protein 7